jgi:hypothetical protein
MGFRVSAPASDTGYNRSTDWPVAGGAGKGVGMGIKSTLSSSIGTNTATQWHPTVAWMLGFVVAEMIAFHFLSRFLNI